MQARQTVSAKAYPQPLGLYTCLRGGWGWGMLENHREEKGGCLSDATPFQMRLGVQHDATPQVPGN